MQASRYGSASSFLPQFPPVSTIHPGGTVLLWRLHFYSACALSASHVYPPPVSNSQPRLHFLARL